jgi:hypothetical protein
MNLPTHFFTAGNCCIIHALKWRKTSVVVKSVSIPYEMINCQKTSRSRGEAIMLNLFPISALHTVFKIILL